MMRRIGLVAGSFKPFTAGHYNLVKKASDECDEVILFVSTGNRQRPGEFGLTWEHMKPVWDRYLHPAINNLRNVQLELKSQPIRAIYELLINANHDPRDHDLYVLYSDPNDMQLTYSNVIQMKYWPRLFSRDQVLSCVVNREETDGISGTIMRNALAKGDMEAFIAGLPEPIRPYGSDIFSLLI